MDNNIEFKTILDKLINKDRINHAYLIETNSSDRLSLGYSLIEKILKESNIDITIEELKRYNDLFVLSSDAQYIKKEEIINLKDELSTKSVYSGKRFYVIEEAEKLNKSSANTLLKFLEEPEDNIHAVLITNNRYSIIETILSRCQVIRFYDKEEISRVQIPEYYENVINFIEKLEKEKEKMIAYINYFFSKEDFERKRFQDILQSMIYIYYDVLQTKVEQNIIYSVDYKEKIKEISNNLTFEELNTRIKSIYEAINKTKNNANTKLVLDSLIIESIGGIKNV